MRDNSNYRNYPIIAEAMKAHNNTMPGVKFNLIDYNILCLVKSYNDAGNTFYMSNEKLGDQLISCEKTVRVSIKRLCDAGLITKHKKPGSRILILNESNLEEFLADMESEMS